MKSIKSPQFLSDVYRDLRDRHLLLPVAALAIALIAVPMLLKSPDTPAIAPAPAPASSGKPSALSAAVLADDSVSVRNYSKRLAELKSKNPFKPQFVPTFEDVSTEAATDTTGAAAGSTDTATDVPVVDVAAPGGTVDVTETTDTVDESTTVDTIDETDTDTTTGGNGNGNGGTGNQPSSDDVEVVNHLVTRRVDLTIGLQGDPKLRENVKPMTILPDATTPVVAFLGTDEQGKRAAFVLSKDATMTAGDGACVPTPENCLYITLEKNETATLSYGLDGQTFVLRLLGIEDHELKAD